MKKSQLDKLLDDHKKAHGSSRGVWYMTDRQLHAERLAIVSKSKGEPRTSAHDVASALMKKAGVDESRYNVKSLDKLEDTALWYILETNVPPQATGPAAEAESPPPSPSAEASEVPDVEEAEAQAKPKRSRGQKALRAISGGAEPRD